MSMRNLTKRRTTFQRSFLLSRDRCRIPLRGGKKHRQIFNVIKQLHGRLECVQYDRAAEMIIIIMYDFIRFVTIIPNNGHT